jgi:H+-transporting ATPase
MEVDRTILADSVVASLISDVVRGNDFDEVILMALSLVIASVPVALPMVMQITMAIGARKMADHKAIVTHLTALQEIASMTVLCSDKTGTLTTAHITVMPDQIWCNPAAGYSTVRGQITFRRNIISLRQIINTVSL